jgi:hypothetical protein
MASLEQHLSNCRGHSILTLLQRAIIVIGYKVRSRAVALEPYFFVDTGIGALLDL